MNKKTSLYGLVSGGLLLSILGAGGGSAPQTPTPTPTPTPTNSQSSGTANASTSDKTYTMADVQQHKDGTSCWTAINGNVYDVTSWINQHPGGPEAILSLCGTDGSSAFNDQHGGQRRPEQELASFKIGTLQP